MRDIQKQLKHILKKDSQCFICNYAKVLPKESYKKTLKGLDVATESVSATKGEPTIDLWFPRE